MVINKTKEELGKGYQILGAIMPIKKDSNSKATFWKTLTKGANGPEKWFNIFINGLTIIAFFIMLFSIVFFPVSFLYKLITRSI